MHSAQLTPHSDSYAISKQRRTSLASMDPSLAPPCPAREDCWTEEATHTLLDAWGDRYVQLNRGNLGQKQWQEVADAVNARHAHFPNSLRSDVQCKNRIDTLKKKFKIEKARVFQSCGSYVSSWPFFALLDALIGSTFPKSSSPVAVGNRKTPPTASQAWNLSSPVPVGPRTHKRPPPAGHSRRNFLVFSAAEGEGSEDLRGSIGTESEGGRVRSGGYRELAQAIERFGEIYERVEWVKQRQMIELEKQKMQFAKDLECHRMQLLLETQVQLQKMKRARRSESYS
ncbi:trihelix transcription factor ASIL2-like isoform X1 [Juglans regia]|uniref:Trihelix transcription factor ASIL2-like isoform X1 n=2 Tax=Juglans regia TaxID=51240 RepID=A0A2I4DUL1_JUGRE|nr:trihelix transcription factor ASIL2-like isoform X1 [Juglans regia]